MSSRLLRLAALAVAVLALVAPAAAQSTAADPLADYVVAPQDVLRVTVFEEPTLSNVFAIDNDGSISYPFLGRLEVEGLTLREVERLIADRLMDGFVRQPQVTVEIQTFRPRSVFVIGEVRTPGEYPIEGRLTLLEALAAAGSTTQAAGTEVRILRTSGADGEPISPNDLTANVMRIDLVELQRGLMSENIDLEDGDTVFVPQAQRFFVSGEVNTPGSYALRPGMTVLQAVSLAGGLTDRGSNRRIQVIRIREGAQVTEDIDLDDLVQADDTINVRRRLF